MKTRKREFFAVLALLIGAVLLLSGCPAPIQGSGNGGDPTDPPPGGNGEPQPYNIRMESPTPNGSVAHPNTADPDDLVTITLTGNLDYEPVPESLHIYYTGNNTVPFTRTDYYTYTFTMPKADVNIRVTFNTLLSVAQSATTNISEYSTWIEIGFLNGLIRKLQDKQLLSGYPAQAKASIDKLAGPSDATATATIPIPYQVGGIYLSPGVGIIQQKMRNEPLERWVPSLVPPSYPIDKGAEILEPIAASHPLVGSGQGQVPANTPMPVDRTHLYYVKEDNPGIPAAISAALVLGNGWEAGTPFTTTKDTAGIYLDGVQEVPLIYKVGYNHTVNYQMWLWPCAQYSIVYDPGATGTTVSLQDYEFLKGVTPSAAPTSLTGLATRGGPQQFTTTSAQQRTGDVGKPSTLTGVGRELLTSLSITVYPPTVYRSVTVTDSSGNLVRNVIDTTDASYDKIVLLEAGESFSINTLNATKPSSDPPTWVGAFYPESKKYTIRVAPVTPFVTPPIIGDTVGGP